MSKLAALGGTPCHENGWPGWPQNSPLEEQAVLRVLRSGEWWKNSLGESIKCAITQDPPASEAAQFESTFAMAHACKFGISCANGTVALEIALRAAGIAPGDEVIVPPYTFIATATAPLMVGAIPIFVDIEPDTCNISPEAIRQAITSKTKAIIPVHFAGLPANMDQILAIAREYGLAVIEDCAHAHGAAYHHQMVGSFGLFGTFSFQGSKNLTAGEGGIVVTNDRDKAELAQSFVWGGRFPGSGWYGHANLASNLRMTELQAALLSAQLTRLPEWFSTRYRNGRLLDSMLDSIQGVKPMAASDHGTTHAYHLYLFRYDSSKFNGVAKATFVKALQAEGIPASAGYDYPLYQNPIFLDKRFWPGGYPFIQGVYDKAIDYAQFKHTCPAAEKACSSEVIWLPQYALLADTGAMEDVAVAIDKIRLHSADLL